MIDFSTWFTSATKHDAPRSWQKRLAFRGDCESHVVRVPTGQGKTQGILAAWLWNRCVRGDDAWPRRLVWVLPMRVLTEQTVAEAQEFLRRAGLSEQVGVHALMGGVSAEDWHLYPEREAILVGTQDMLISRALNRGYAASRARWPMDFGFLSQDALWVFDEIQLMDVALATSAQLQAFRDDDSAKHLRPVHSWWMSATLQPEWLHTVDTAKHHELWTEAPTLLEPKERESGWCAVAKPLKTTAIDATDAGGLAKLVLSVHQADTLTLVVCNTVARACETYDALKSADRDGEIELVHSRFRPKDREEWRERFLSRESCAKGIDRIIIATQVVEAGVDISARTLITDLAPWPSLVQRFGRCARYDDDGTVLVVDRGHEEKKGKKKNWLPYTPEEMRAAWAVLQELNDVGIGSLESYEEQLDDEGRRQLYPYEPAHLLLRRELDELFDTTPDLTGADLDISRFIRSGEERDCYVCWHEWPDKNQPPEDFQPIRESLCPVPVHRAKDWIKKQGEVLRPHVFDYLDSQWQSVRDHQLRPGLVLVVDARGGGYDPKRGFTGKKAKKKSPPVPLVDPATSNIDDRADRGQDQEDLSEKAYQHIAAHNREVGAAARGLAELCAPEHSGLLDLAGRLHDWGKAHPAFQGSIKVKDPGNRGDLAKAPSDAWHRGARLYPMPGGEPRRPGFRHELVSVLAIFELLARHDQHHAALLGGLEDVIACGALSVTPVEGGPQGAMAAEIAALDARQVDLLCYLIASHHGKLRASWHPCPQDQEYSLRGKDKRGFPLRGVREGDELPAIALCSADGEEVMAPAVTLHLDPANLGLNGCYGRSWRERSLALQGALGPAALAYLEALLRAADIRVSRGPTREER